MPITIGWVEWKRKINVFLWCKSHLKKTVSHLVLDRKRFCESGNRTVNYYPHHGKRKTTNKTKQDKQTLSNFADKENSKRICLVSIGRKESRVKQKCSTWKIVLNKNAVIREFYIYYLLLGRENNYYSHFVKGRTEQKLKS